MSFAVITTFFGLFNALLIGVSYVYGGHKLIRMLQSLGGGKQTAATDKQVVLIICLSAILQYNALPLLC